MAGKKSLFVFELPAELSSATHHEIRRSTRDGDVGTIVPLAPACLLCDRLVR